MECGTRLVSVACSCCQSIMLDCARGRCQHKRAKVDSKCPRDEACIGMTRLFSIVEQHRKIGIVSDGPSRGSLRVALPSSGRKGENRKGGHARDTPAVSRELRCKGKAEK